MPHPVRFLKSARKEFHVLLKPVQDDILEKVELLKEFPYAGVAMDQSYEGYYSILAWKKQYRIIYQILENDVVEIAYIRHCRRQISLRSVPS